MDAQEIEKRLPRGAGLILRQPLKYHQDLEAVARLGRHQFAPVRIEEVDSVEVDELCEEAAKGVVRVRVDREAHDTKVLRQLMGGQCQPRHDAERAAAAALQRPEQVGLLEVADDADPAIGGDDFRLDQAGGSAAEALGETTKAAALHQTRHSHRSAPAALDVTPGADTHRLISVQPHCPRAA